VLGLGLIAGGLFAGALAAAVGALILALRTRQRLATWPRTVAVVTGFRQIAPPMGRGSTLHYPEVKFTLPDGTSVDAVSEVGSTPSPYRVGGPIRLRYDAHNPTRVIPDGFLSNWAFALVLLVFAIFLCGFSVIFFAIFLLVSLVPASQPTPIPS
jgi:hypothetical protein